MQRRHSRRGLLSASGSVGLVALAGCSGVLRDDDPAEDGIGPANESDGDAGNGGDDGNSTDDASDDETPPMPDPVDWTGEDRGTISVGPDGDREFEPDAVRITPGTLVRWLWESDGHGVTPVDQPADADWPGEEQLADEGHGHEFTFERVGTYAYVCEPHRGQGARGYVIVDSI